MVCNAERQHFTQIFLSYIWSISPTVEALVLGTSQYRFESDIDYVMILAKFQCSCPLCCYEGSPREIMVRR